MVKVCANPRKGEQLRWIKKSWTSILGLLLMTGVQFGVAGLGSTIVCMLRKEKFKSFGLTRKNIVKAIIETIGCFLPYICYVFASGQFDGFHPFHIAITDEVIASGIPAPISSWNLQGIDSLNKGVLQLLQPQAISNAIRQPCTRRISSTGCLSVYIIQFSPWPGPDQFIPGLLKRRDSRPFTINYFFVFPPTTGSNITNFSYEKIPLINLDTSRAIKIYISE